MKIMLYTLKRLGITKSLLYLVIYPLRFFRNGLARLDDLHDEKRWHKKMYIYLNLQASNNLKVLPQNFEDAAKKKFSKFEYGVNLDWHRFYYHHNGRLDLHYIPENIFFRQIEPLLNSSRRNFYHEDKNNYSKILKNFRQPGTVLRYIKGSYYCHNYKILTESEANSILQTYQKPWIIKPSIDSGGGKQIFKGESKNKSIYLKSGKVLLNDIANRYQRGFIIQESVLQPAILDQFHPESLNTFRVVTLRLHQEITVLSSIVKFGTGNFLVDNLGKRGIWCGVTEDGKMSNVGYTNKFQKLQSHPDSQIDFENIDFHFFESIKDFAINMHKELIYFDLVSWDIAINKDEEPVLIEYNLRYQSISNHQVANGPLFGDLTDDVLAEVVRRRDANRA